MPKQTKTTNKQNIEINNVICPINGVIIESDNEAKESIEYIDNELEKLKAHKKHIKKNHKLDDKELVVNTHKYFYKLYKGNWKVFNSLSSSTCKILLFFICNMDYRDNSVSINDRHLTYTELCKIIKVSKTTFEKAIKELKENNIIVSEKKGHYNVIYLNPSIIEDSKTEKGIYRKFEK